MVPQTIRLWDALPRTLSGKLDRKALEGALTDEPALTVDALVSGPPSATEERLIAIFREFLGCREVPLGDGFFAIGGTSFAAARIVERIRTEFSRDMSIVRFLTLSTIRNIARHLEASSEARPQQTVVHEEWIL
jgi:hypothetical protein